MADESNPGTDAARPNDFVDDLFDYDVGLDGILQEINTNSNNAHAPNPSAPPHNAGVVLGLDEEVKVAKKRQPVAKLDENRLLTQAGIPKLRRSARKNLKFKGKGHEFSDLARLLNFYQLWLDDLFPRAKFADGLAMIERLGHSKRLQTMRRAWIEEEKPKAVDENSSVSNYQNTVTNDASAEDILQSIPTDTARSPGRLDDADEDLFMPDSDNHSQRSANDSGGVPDDDDFDELDALLREQVDEPGTGKTVPSNGDYHQPPKEDDFDELDDLLREHENGPGAANSTLMETQNDIPETDSHADDLEAMEGLEMFGNGPEQ
ncbi:replication fork protection component Swi3-domain-containing protein [Aspergillus oleicola]